MGPAEDPGSRGFVASILGRVARHDPRPAPDVDPERLESLEARINHLESLIEGLQDAMHRLDLRQERDVANLTRQVAPGSMTRSLARHAREHGIE